MKKNPFYNDIISNNNNNNNNWFIFFGFFLVFGFLFIYLFIWSFKDRHHIFISSFIGVMRFVAIKAK